MADRADLVFDLDGTISDPLLGIFRCINHALRSHGLAEVSEVQVARLIGPPLDAAFRALRPDCNDVDVASLVRSYRERYSRVGYAENFLYEGVTEAIALLHGSGRKLGVCTAKRVDFAERILERFEIRGYFSFIDGGDVGISKRSQLERLKAGGRVGDESVMIGDRSVDIEAARVNGLASAGVLWGYGTEAELKSAGAGSILERTDELSRFAIGTR